MQFIVTVFFQIIFFILTYLASEVLVVKMVQDYYKDLIDDAVEEVDRVINAEGKMAA